MKSNEIVLLLHIEGEDPLELICDSGDPILRTLLEAFFSSETRDGKNSLIHLRITENNEPCDLFIRASQIKLIKTIPPLNVDSLYAEESDSGKSNKK
ncbi:hypothetical protein N9H39_05575 [Gammaproteobacteria bacterium]|nr:hypothetical protein [Gammaproteobacteria bacterium]